MVCTIKKIEMSKDTKSVIKNAANKLSGAKRREFIGEITIEFLDGNARKAEREFGWGRETVKTGMSELTTGIICLNNYSARGNKKTEEKMPELADAIERMVNRATLADALYQAGSQSEAESLFREAEKMQKEDQHEYPFLYLFRGFKYCDLLLSQGNYQEVLSRAEQTLEWAKVEGGSLLTIALDHLSLERAHLLRALQKGSQDFTPAKEQLNQAVDGMRQARHQEFITHGMLARTELYRVRGEFDKAQHDLDEAMTIAERGEMGLHQADCHLEYARLYLAMGREEDTRKCLDSARGMVEKMGYHRRDKDIVEIEAQL